MGPLKRNNMKGATATNKSLQILKLRMGNCGCITLCVYAWPKGWFVDSVKFMVTDCLQADRETTEVGDRIHIRLT